ncbi:MAG: DUF928 domain-containing protein [Desulfobacteraceae bacterium]|nr:DUF928 domain-containing protein [Desulfobacteraceae bacterium]
MRNDSVVLKTLAFVVAFMVAACPSQVFSQDAKGAAGSLTYKPPMLGAPAGGGRVAAAVRGIEGETPTLLALAPDHVGLTSQRQPTLYWYISKPTTSRIEFTLNDDKGAKTLVKAQLQSPKEGGIQVLSLADHKAELTPGVVYQWFISIEVDPKQPSKDVYHGGSILYREPSPELKKQLESAGAAKSPALYAAEGLWYDALGATYRAGKPAEKKTAAQQRITLLKQVGYGETGAGKSDMVRQNEGELLQYLSQ